MRVVKNFEALFLASAILATFASYATADEPARYSAAPVAASAVATDSTMQVVVIKGQRLSAAQKADLG